MRVIFDKSDILNAAVAALLFFGNSYAKQNSVWPYEGYNKEPVAIEKTEKTKELEKELCPKYISLAKYSCSIAKKQDNNNVVYVFQSSEKGLERVIEHDVKTKAPVRDLRIANSGSSNAYIFAEENYSGKIDLVEQL